MINQQHITKSFIYRIIIIVLSISNFQVFGQNSIQQDTYGQTAIKNSLSNQVILNAAHKSFQLTFLFRDVFKSDENISFQNKGGIWGLNTKIFSNESISTLINANTLPLDFQAGFFYSPVKINPTIIDGEKIVQFDLFSYYFSAGLIGTSNRLYNKSENLFNSDYFLGNYVELGLLRIKSLKIMGFNINLEYTDNSKELEVSQYTIYNQLQPGTNLVNRTEYAYNIDEYKSNIFILNVNADYDLNLFSVGPYSYSKLVYLSVHSRYRLIEFDDNFWRMGLGIYLADNETPLNKFLGINYLYDIMGEPEESNYNLVFGIFF